MISMEIGVRSSFYYCIGLYKLFVRLMDYTLSVYCKIFHNSPRDKTRVKLKFKAIIECVININSEFLNFNIAL